MRKPIPLGKFVDNPEEYGEKIHQVHITAKPVPGFAEQQAMREALHTTPPPPRDPRAKVVPAGKTVSHAEDPTYRAGRSPGIGTLNEFSAPRRMGPAL